MHCLSFSSILNVWCTSNIHYIYRLLSHFDTTMINFTVIFFFILDAKPWGKIPSRTERWCWSACMSFSITKLETNKSHWRRDWQCVVVSKTKIIIHNDWRYLSMVHQCLKASFHSCVVFGSILYNTVIWILWSKQSQFPLVI